MPRIKPVLVLFLLGVSLESAFAAVGTRVAPAAPELAPVSFSIFRVIGALALVLALFVGGALLLRRWQTVSLGKGGPSQLALLEARPLGNRQTLYLVGYEKQRLLIASSAAGVSLVTNLPPAEINAAVQCPPATTFADALRSVLSRP